MGNTLADVSIWCRLMLRPPEREKSFARAINMLRKNMFKSHMFGGERPLNPLERRVLVMRLLKTPGYRAFHLASRSIFISKSPAPHFRSLSLSPPSSPPRTGESSLPELEINFHQLPGHNRKLIGVFETLFDQQMELAMDGCFLCVKCGYCEGLQRLRLIKIYKKNISELSYEQEKSLHWVFLT